MKILGNKLLIVIILAIFLRLIYLDASYIFWDEAVNLMEGKALVSKYSGYTEFDIRPPLLRILIAPFTLLPNYVLISKLFMIILNSALIFLIYIFGRQFSENIGILSAFLVAILPFHILSSSWMMSDGLAAIFLLLTILFYFKGFKQNKNIFLYLGGFFLSVAVLAKFTNLLLLIILLPLFILNFKKFYKIILKSLLIALLTLSPFLIMNYINFGNPVHIILTQFKIGNIMLEKTGFLSISLIIKTFYDLFGVLTVFIFLGILLFIKNEAISNKKIKKENIFWIYCFLIFIPYYLYTVHEGSTPIWWESQRFLISFLPFAFLFSSYSIFNLINRFSIKTKQIIFVILILIIILTLMPQYTRFLQPSIDRENGLRYVTKEIGIYLKDGDIDNLVCLGNCPPIAYYSNKKMSILYNLKDFESASNQYKIIFSDNIEKLKSSYENIKTICKDRWCVYLLK